MAKRYAKFEDLASVTGEWKPAGTMGKHNATVVHQGDTTVVVGSISGRVTLHTGDTLGYNCGEVWMVPKPESFNDPLRRLLAERRIPQRVLEFVKSKDFSLETTERWYDQQHCPNGRPTHEWKTDGEVVELDSKELERPQGYFSGGGERTIRVEHPSYAIRVDYGRHGNGFDYHHVARILVWPGCDQAKLLEAVRQARHSG